MNKTPLTVADTDEAPAEPLTGPTYADAVERVSAALMFREPMLARTAKAATETAHRAINALIIAGAMVPTVQIPPAATDGD